MYRNLEAELARKGISRADIAKALGIAIATVSEKLNNTSRMKLGEAMAIRDTFFPDMTMDYLFAKDTSTTKPA
jgi:transcriptional regulator with XRE-family HTH domain